MTHPALYSPRFDAAVALAADAFRCTVRKGTAIPYITHLFQVMVTVAENGGDEDQLIAALLHDYLEDVDGASADDLETRFGPRVRTLVEALSDSTSHPKPPWRARKESYIAALRAESSELKLISVSDKLHNIESILRDYERMGESLWARFTGRRDGTLWYYREIVEALGDGWDHPLVDRLRDRVATLERITCLPDSASPG